MELIKILALNGLRNPDFIGEKARNLLWLHRHGRKIPLTYVIPYAAYQHYKTLGLQSLNDHLRISLSSVIDPQRSYAVRSSANLEDSAQHSFAGQFKTVLNLRGVDAIMQGIQEIFQADESMALERYARHSGKSIENLQLAIIIQEMVEPLISGVVFSKNPITGLSEVIIEAVHGSGDRLVQGGVTPARWVYHLGKWTTRPSSCDIDNQLIHRVVEETLQISREYKAPVDLEWVFDGSELFWVQLRPITRLESINIYSCRIPREMFPGIIKPLIWSVNIPLVNTLWIKLFTELIGPNDLTPEELAKTFAYRVYFNMGVIGRIFTWLGLPRETLEILLGMQGDDEKPRFKLTFKTVLLFPRVVGFLLRRLRLSRQVEAAIPEIHRQLRSLTAKPADQLREDELLSAIDELFEINQKTTYYNIIVPLVMGMANMMLRRQLSRIGIDYARFDLMSGMDEIRDYDPNYHLGLLANEYSRLDESCRQAIASSAFAEFCSMPGISEFQDGVLGFINRFGHLSDSGNDFSAVPWRETPELVLEMIKQIALQQSDSQDAAWQSMKWMHDQPGAGSQDVTKDINWDSLPVSGFQRVFIKPVYQTARKFRLYREKVSSLYTYGYGLFRIYFLELGKRLAASGKLEVPDDVFYLEWKEIKDIVQSRIISEQNKVPVGVDPRVIARKAEILNCQDAVLPEVIFGDELPPLQHPDQQEYILRGIPTSRGYYQGPAKVIRSVADFGKMAAGDVLVIPYSDVSWAPLFTRAGAVIAESGGMLSHSSIVAREYQIPAVVSVAGAMRLSDGMLVTVDGFKGEVFVHSAL